MATLSDLPDELLALIVRELTPLPPLPMRNSSATLLDEILAVCRNPGHPDQDLRSIMHVSQRLRVSRSRARITIPTCVHAELGSSSVSPGNRTTTVLRVSVHWIGRDLQKHCKHIPRGREDGTGVDRLAG